MKQIRSFIAGFILAAVLVAVGVHVSAGIASFKADLVAAVTNDFLAADRTRISNGFVSQYQGEWNARVAAGTVDNAANRGDFAADKVIDYMKTIVRASENNASIAAVPTPTPLTP